MLIGATLPTKAGAVTLFDIAQGLDPDGKVARTINLLSQTNEMLNDMTWMEGNLPTGHKSTILTGLPVPIWRKLYQGVPPSKATRANVTDSIGMLEARSEVDVDAYKLNGNSAAWRLAESGPFLEAMNQNMAETVLYGDASVNAERFTGFAPRYSSLSAGNGGNIIDAGGSGSNNTSVWLVIWSENTVTGIYPKGSPAGLDHQDLGEYDAFDELNNRYRALGDLWKWKAGVTVRDWRYVVRIANINVSDLLAQTGTQAPTAATALMKLMIQAQTLIPNMGMGRAAFYANRTVKGALSKAALDKSNSAVAIVPATNQFGAVAPGYVQKDTQFFGTPIRTVDRILNTEARIV
ncbi:hypothetical protein APR50_10505 [Variovorax paradoxus]|nr:hypothetical protein APR52_20755 [Variovorax paradoxus]KPV08931.1 hypothetical protein APR50_10505 [Variovorax paradoxus]KPV11429.1 hypothetical protein APR49_09380 [Variovorax paradoxus]KPV23317.1 hypothetical protein APR51_07955 [Variovorax paradoxus]KPV31189.1 hypothetical protein APR48_17650 [Variovorax paradoxus]